MAVPQFLAGDFHFFTRLNVVDVQTIINDVYTQLLLDGWTCTAGGDEISPTTMRSPARADYARFSITMTRISDTVLQWQVYDHTGALCSSSTDGFRRTTITAAGAGTSVYYCTGPTHCIVNNVGGTNSTALACILDTEPYASLLAPIPWYFSKFGDDDPFQGGFAWDRSTSVYASGAYGIRRHSNQSADQAAITMSGAWMSNPLDILYYNAIPTLLGRVPQLIIVDNAVTAESDLIIPIDAAVTATFWAIGNGYYGRMAIRKA
jgi:hypothetical protein